MYDYEFPDAGRTAWSLISQTWPALHKIMKHELAKVGLTPEQTDVLLLCHDFPCRLTPIEISRLLFRESQSVTGLLARMERDGLVTRVPRRKEHPFVEVKITAKGEELIRRGREVALNVIEGITSSLSEEELEQLQTLLRKLRQKAIDKLDIELRLWPGRVWR